MEQKKYITIEIELNKEDLKTLFNWNITNKKTIELKNKVMGSLFNSYINGFFKNVTYLYNNKEDFFYKQRIIE